MSANKLRAHVVLLFGLLFVGPLAFGQALTFSPNPVTFPDVIVGNYFPLPLTITNVSSSAVTITSVSMTSTDFQVAVQYPQTINAGLSTAFTVVFHPSTPGSRSATATFNFATGTTQTLQFSGKGIAAAATITVSPSNASFGAYNVGATSGWMPFVITNTGNVSAQFTSIVSTGDFAITYSNCTTSLSPGATCQVAVAFSPTAAGTRNGSLTISSTAANSPTVASLSGTGIIIVPSNNLGLGPCRAIPVSSVVGQTPTSIPNYLGPPVIATIDVPTLDVTSTSLIPGGIFIYDAGNGARSTTVGNCFPTGAVVTVQFNARTAETGGYLSTVKQFYSFDSAGIAGMSISSATIQNSSGTNQSSVQIVVAAPGTAGNPILTAGGSGIWLHDIHFDATTLSPGSPLTATVTVVDTSGTVLSRSTTIVGFVPGAVSPTSGWWWNPATPGIGFFIERNDSDRIFAADFLYDVDGRATWTLSSGALKSNTFAQLLNTYGKGQTLTGSYQANQQTDTVGAVSLEFSSSSSGMMIWPGGSMPIQRFSFTGSATPAVPAAGMPESGWWWNPFESGRGYAIEIQGNSLFLCGFMYDASGNPIWYLTSGQMTNTSDYVGVWTQYSSGQSLIGPYKPNQLSNGNVGAISIHFSDTRNAILTLPTGRQIVLTRFQF